MKNKIFTLSFIFFLTLSPLAALADSPDPSFNANKLIEDRNFSDTQTFGGAAGVQKFLEAKNSVLANTSPDFLVMLKEPVSTLLKQGLSDPEPNLPRLRTAAELIWDASVQSGLNPQVILVTLNKEQSLITGKFTQNSDLQKALDHAMGFACPDSGGCGNLFPGFYYQIFGNYDSDGNRYLGAAKSLMKSFLTQGGRGPIVAGLAAKVGDTITLQNTLGGFDNVPEEQNVQILNNATAALYRYTPHVFNGNYNFWRFFIAWFRYENGTLIKMASGADTYIIQNGLKQLVPSFVAKARGLNLASAITVSPTEFDNYQTDQILGPSDNTIVAVPGEGQKYVFVNNVKHPASDFVIRQRGLDPQNVLAVTTGESQLFSSGVVLTPLDGTILRGQADKTVYLVQNGNLLAFSSFTFSQRKISAKQVVSVPDAEVATYPKFGFVTPLDGTVFKSANNSTVFLAQSGLKLPVTAEIFKNRKLKNSSVVVLSGDEVGSFPTGAYAAPLDKSFFSITESGQFYEYKDGSKHPISAFVAKQRGITPDFKVSQQVAYEWADGIAIPPRDNTMIKGNSDATVYLVSGGQLRPLTAQAFKNRKITAKKISILPQAEVDSYAKGDTIIK